MRRQCIMCFSPILIPIVPTLCALNLQLFYIEFNSCISALWLIDLAAILKEDVVLFLGSISPDSACL